MRVLLTRCSISNCNEPEVLEIPDDSTVKNVVTMENLGHREIITVNGKRVNDDFALQDGDKIVVLPHLFGG